ncbi:synaptosomal-associated protein 29-like [Ornithodoros turicata]
MANVSKNPFFDGDTEDVDDFTFLNHPRQGSSGYMLGNGVNPAADQWEQRREQLLQERRQLEDSMLQTSSSAVRVLYDTEQVGISTAEELVRQGEQLKNVDQKLDNINSSMKTSQKHLNSMKSIFGGIKSYFNRGSSSDTTRAPAPPRDSEPEPRPTTELEKALERVKLESGPKSAVHPALKMRGIDTEDFGSSLDDGSTTDYYGKPQLQTDYRSRTAEVEERLDSNLAELGSGLGRLKNLARGLGKELDDQSELLSTINEKADLAEGTIQHQNSQIRRILKR